MGMAVVERLRGVISALPRLSAQRSNSQRELLGVFEGGGFTITADPRKTYKQQQAEAIQRAAAEAAAVAAAAEPAAGTEQGSSGGASGNTPPAGSQHLRDDARRLQTLTRTAPAAAAAVRPPTPIQSQARNRKSIPPNSAQPKSVLWQCPCPWPLAQSSPVHCTCDAAAGPARCCG